MAHPLFAASKRTNSNAADALITGNMLIANDSNTATHKIMIEYIPEFKRRTAKIIYITRSILRHLCDFIDNINSFLSSKSSS